MTSMLGTESSYLMLRGYYRNVSQSVKGAAFSRGEVVLLGVFVEWCACVRWEGLSDSSNVTGKTTTAVSSCRGKTRDTRRK